MVADFGKLGVVEARPGVEDDGTFPPVMLVESKPDLPAAAHAQGLVAAEDTATIDTQAKGPLPEADEAAPPLSQKCTDSRAGLSPAGVVRF